MSARQQHAIEEGVHAAAVCCRYRTAVILRLADYGTIYTVQEDVLTVLVVTDGATCRGDDRGVSSPPVSRFEPDNASDTRGAAHGADRPRIEVVSS